MSLPSYEDAGLSAVPLFPLPNVVLFPRAVLPLHIFEERYRAMTADVLEACGEARGRLAMALLLPGWQKNYYGRPPIAEVVCVGRILSHERLPDGCYNFLLQGVQRARIVREVPGRPYRRADLAPLRERRALEIDLEEERRMLRQLFSSGPVAALPVAGPFVKLLDSPIPTDAAADMAAFHFLDDVALKQELLSDADVRRRVGRTLAALAEWASQQRRPAAVLATADPQLN